MRHRILAVSLSLFSFSIGSFAAAEDAAPLGPRIVDGATGISFRPPDGFAVEEPKKPREKAPPDTISEVLRLTAQRSGQIVVLAVETSADALVTQIAGDGLNIVRSNFGAEQYASEDEFSAGGFTGRAYLFTELSKQKDSEALCYVFGRERLWHIVLAIYAKAKSPALRETLRASLATFERYTQDRLDALLGEPVLVSGTPLGLRAPIAFWAAPPARVPQGAVLALVEPYSVGATGTLAVHVHPKATTPLALAEEATAAITAAVEGLEVKKERKLVVADREWRLIPFVAGGESILAALVVEGGRGYRIEYGVAGADVGAATDVLMPVIVGADFADEATRKKRVQIGKESYLRGIKSGTPADAAPHLVELVRSGDAKEAVPVLVSALAEKPQPVRLAAVRGLGAIAAGRSEAFAGLKKIAELPPTKDGPEMAVQLAALRALGQLGDPKATPVLVKKLGEANAAAFDIALEGLARIGEPKKQISDQMIRAWSKLESAAKNPKDQAAKDRLEDAQPKLVQALAYLTGEEFDSARAAREWWDKN